MQQICIHWMPPTPLTYNSPKLAALSTGCLRVARNSNCCCSNCNKQLASVGFMVTSFDCRGNIRKVGAWEHQKSSRFNKYLLLGVLPNETTFCRRSFRSSTHINNKIYDLTFIFNRWIIGRTRKRNFSRFNERYLRFNSYFEISDLKIYTYLRYIFLV